MKNISALIVFILVSGSLIAGGGWPQKKGEGYFKVSQWWVIADKHFTNNGGIDPNTTNGIFNTSFYGEYGITNKLTAILYAPIFSRAYFNNTISGTTGETLVPGEAINGIGDVDISVKYGLITDKPVVVSATLTLGLPLGESAGGSQGNLQTGDGEFNQMLQIDASTSATFGKINTWYTLYGAFNNRTNGFSDEIRYGAEAGGKFFGEKVLGIIRLYGVTSLKNGSSTDTPNSTSIFANNSEHITISPEIAYQITPKLGISATYATAIRGSLIFANPAYSVGIYLKI